MQLTRPLCSSTEAKRIEVLKRYEILDTPPDGSFDHITKMTAELLEMPVSILSFVDTDRVWFKSKYGLELQEMSREAGLCTSAILSRELFLVENADEDSRTLSNPLVVGNFGLRFYAAVPLTTPEGYNLGTLGVIDYIPRKFTAVMESTLKNLAELVVQQLELRLDARTAIKKQHQILNVTAHDLKNPLSIMPLLADLIIHNKNNPKAIDDIAHQIKTAGQRMTKTITDILDAARDDAGRVQLRLKALDLSVIIKGVVASNWALAKNKGQIIRLRTVKKTMVFGDHQKLSEIIDNLINNAIKYSPIGEEIHISLSSKQSMAVIEIKDFGPGLTRDDLKNLFRKFTSLSAQPTGGESSSGLGLSIVKQLVDAHRGKIYAYSEGEGKGATFTVEIPVSED